MISFTWPKAKSELREDTEPEFSSCFSPETVGLIQGLGDTPESLALKAEYVKAFNELKRGPINRFCMVRMFNPSRLGNMVVPFVVWVPKGNFNQQVQTFKHIFLGGADPNRFP